MDKKTFLAVHGSIHVHQLEDDKWIQISESNILISICYSAQRGPFCLSIDGNRVILDKNITSESFFKVDSPRFGHWRDDITNETVGFGFFDNSGSEAFKKVFHEVKTLSKNLKFTKERETEEVLQQQQQTLINQTIGNETTQGIDAFGACEQSSESCPLNRNLLIEPIVSIIEPNTTNLQERKESLAQNEYLTSQAKKWKKKAQIYKQETEKMKQLFEESNITIQEQLMALWSEKEYYQQLAGAQKLQICQFINQANRIDAFDLQLNDQILHQVGPQTEPHYHVPSEFSKVGGIEPHIHQEYRTVVNGEEVSQESPVLGNRTLKPTELFSMNPGLLLDANERPKPTLPQIGRFGKSSRRIMEKQTEKGTGNGAVTAQINPRFEYEYPQIVYSQIGRLGKGARRGSEKLPEETMMPTQEYPRSESGSGKETIISEEYPNFVNRSSDNTAIRQLQSGFENATIIAEGYPILENESIISEVNPELVNSNGRPKAVYPQTGRLRKGTRRRGKPKIVTEKFSVSSQDYPTLADGSGNGIVISQGYSRLLHGIEKATDVSQGPSGFGNASGKGKVISPVDSKFEKGQLGYQQNSGMRPLKDRVEKSKVIQPQIRILGKGLGRKGKQSGGNEKVTDYKRLTDVSGNGTQVISQVNPGFKYETENTAIANNSSSVEDAFENGKLFSRVYSKFGNNTTQEDSKLGSLAEYVKVIQPQIERLEKGAGKLQGIRTRGITKTRPGTEFLKPKRN